MSATTPAPTTARGSGRRRPPSTADRHPSVRLAGPAALALGAVLAAVGMGLHLPGMPEDLGIPRAIAAAPSRWLAAHLLHGFGFAFIAIGVTHALPGRRGRGATLTAGGALLTSFGATVMALSDIAHGAVGFALTEVDPATSLAVHEVYFEHPAILGLNTAPMLLSLGMVLLGAGLLRSRRHPRWIGAAVLLAPIAVNVAFSLGLPTWLHGLPIAIGMTALAWTLVRTPQPAGDLGAA